jgi:protein involved in polysaccharide export with SLBB domain
MFFLGLFLVLALAAPLGAAASEYQIGPQEKLRVKVHEWPALSGDITVSPEGMISLPIVGNVKAIGMTVPELSQAISDQLRVRAKLQEQPFTFIEILQFRSYYIIGDVQRPGDYSYRPNMTVLMAVTIAGGAYRATDNLNLVASLARDAVVSKATLSTLDARGLELLIRRGRLNAELQGKDKIDLEAGVEFPRAIIDEELAVMRARREELRTQIDGLRQQIRLSLEEIALLKARAESGVKKQASVERETAGLRALSEKGLGLSARQGELDRLAAQYEGDQREIDSLINRARQTIAQSETDIARVTLQRERDIRVELRQLSTQLEEIEQQRSLQESLLADAGRMGAAVQLPGLSRSVVRLRFRISRRTGNGISEFNVQQNDPVAPDDVIIVDQILVDMGVSSATGIKATPTSSARWAPSALTAASDR